VGYQRIILFRANERDIYDRYDLDVRVFNLNIFRVSYDESVIAVDQGLSHEL
jgi:hypothetical protein